MAYLHTKKPNSCIFWRGLEWKILVYLHNGHLVFFKDIWYILWSFRIFCGHLVCFVIVWYTLWPFGIFCVHLDNYPALVLCNAKKSSNPVNQ
jgi:hypothetical protein